MTAAARSDVFVGPRPFRTGERLFGRDREVADLTNLLLAERVALLYSASGAGKSSLVHAGLVPRLRGDATPKARGRVFDVPSVHPSIDPHKPTIAIRVNGQLPPGAPPGANRYVSSALASLEARKPHAEQREPADLFGLTLAEYLAHEFPDAAGRLPVFLLFDQFEEVLTLDPTEEGATARRVFFGQLGEALSDRRRWALLAAREDYLAEFDPYLPLLPNRLAVRYRLGRLSPEAAREAIVEPPKGTDLQFDPACADALVRNLRQVRAPQRDGYAAGPDVEPVQLQVVCKRLWDMPDAARAVPGLITSPDFEKLVADSGPAGGGAGALSGVDAILAGYYASKVAEAAGVVSERRIRDWFERELITRARTRKPVPASEHPWADLPRDGLTVLDKAYLIREDSRGAVRWLELAHDRLVEPVLRDNARWRAVTLTPFQLAAAAYEESKDRRDDMLVGGEVLKWGEEHEAELTDDETQFLAACRGAADRSRTRARMKLSWAAAAVLLALLAGAGTMVVQVRKQMRAQAVNRDYERRVDQNRRNLDALFQRLADRRRDEADLRLAVAPLNRWDWPQEGDDQGPAPSAADRVIRAVNVIQRADRQGIALPEAETSLRQALQRLSWRGLTKFNETPRTRPAVTAAAFSPKGRWFAACGSETLELWGVQEKGFVGGRRFLGVNEPQALHFAPDDSSLWVRGGGGRLANYSLPADALPTLSWEEHGVGGGTPARALFVPTGADGRETNWVVTAWANGKGEARWVPRGANPWQKSVPIPFDRPPGFKESVGTTAVGFAPRSSWVYTGTRDGRVLAWDLSGPVPVVADTGIKAPGSVTSLAVYPGNTAVAVGTLDSHAELWHLDSPARVARNDEGQPASSPVECSLSGDISALLMHPLGEWLAVVQADRTVEFLRGPLTKGRRDFTVTSSPTWPDVSDLGSAAVFDAAAPDTATTLESPLFLAGAPDGIVRLWTLDRGVYALHHPIRLPGPRSAVTVAALSPDRSWAAVGCKDGTVHVWDVRRATGREPGEPRLLRAPYVERMAVSRDGQWAAVTDGIQLWAWNLHDEAPKRVTLPAKMGAHLLLDGPRLTELSQKSPSVGWDLTAPKEQPEPNPAYAQLPAGRSPFAFTPDHRWVVGMKDEPGQVPQLLIRKAADTNWSARPFAAPGPKPPELPGQLGPRGPDSDPPRVAVGGPGERPAGVRAVTVFGTIRRRPYVWWLDPESGQPTDPVALSLAVPRPGAPPPGAKGAPDDRPPQQYSAVAVSPDGRLAAAATAGTIRVWEVAADREPKLARVFANPSGLVSALAFSPDGKHLASGGSDGAVRVWGISNSTVPVVLPGHTDQVVAVHFVQVPATRGAVAGLRLVTFGQDRMIRIWTLDHETLLIRAATLARTVDKEQHPRR